MPLSASSKGRRRSATTTRVGLGGLPNEEGVVELDACCMHGPSRRAGSVGGVRNIKNVSLVAKAVMEHTGHVMLVGEGAERFAVAMGFPRENLLTEHSRKIWLLWKEYHSTDDWWGPGLADPNWKAPAMPTTEPTAEIWEERIRRLDERAARTRHRAGIPHGGRSGAFFLRPLARSIARRLMTKEKSPAARPPAGLPLNCLDASAIRRSLAPAATPIRMWVRRAPPAAEKRTSKLRSAHTIVENMRHGMSPHGRGHGRV